MEGCTAHLHCHLTVGQDTVLEAELGDLFPVPAEADSLLLHGFSATVTMLQAFITP
jgi:hypothetical protein